MQGENVDVTILSITVVQSLFNCFVFSAISYAMFSSQAHLFIKNKRSVRQTEQMQDVLQVIDDGVIILEEKKEDEDKDESFFNVEFANSFMQKLFGSSFKSDSPESAKRIQQLAKAPIVSKTTKQILSHKEIDSDGPSESTSLQKLILSAEDNSPSASSKDNFLVINAPRQVDENNNDSQRALRPRAASELDTNAFLVQASVRKLVFKDK